MSPAPDLLFWSFFKFFKTVIPDSRSSFGSFYWACVPYRWHLRQDVPHQGQGRHRLRWMRRQHLLPGAFPHSRARRGDVNEERFLHPRAKSFFSSVSLILSVLPIPILFPTRRAAWPPCRVALPPTKACLVTVNSFPKPPRRPCELFCFQCTAFTGRRPV